MKKTALREHNEIPRCSDSLIILTIPPSLLSKNSVQKWELNLKKKRKESVYSSCFILHITKINISMLFKFEYAFVDVLENIIQKFQAY